MKALIGFLLILGAGVAAGTGQVAGTYTGQVNGMITSRQADRSGEFNLGAWSVSIQVAPCGDCDPGQHQVASSLSGFAGITYANTNGSFIQETGYFAAYLNASGSMVDALDIVTNCSVINPSQEDLSPLGGLPTISGNLEGGQAGEVPGATLRIDGNTMHGRISGRNCYNELISADISLVNDAQPATNCIPDTHSMCLDGGRFRVEADWQKSDGTSGQGSAVVLTDDTGYFWFFSSANVEVVAKVLEGCALNEKRWVFAGGLTNVEVSLKITDTGRFGAQPKTYTNSQGAAFQPIQDTVAFPCN